jgi:hypothetical protein
MQQKLGSGQRKSKTPLNPIRNIPWTEFTSGHTKRTSPCCRKSTTAAAADTNSPRYPEPDRCKPSKQHVLLGGQADPVKVWHHDNYAVEQESLELKRRGHAVFPKTMANFVLTWDTLTRRDQCAKPGLLG